MNNNTIYYVAGLPRSGSTLLMNILGQNPNFETTGTNELRSLLSLIKENWANLDSFKAQGLENVKPKIKSLLENMLYGFHKEALDKNLIIFDKNRGWLNDIELLEEITGKQVKIITTIRDVKDVCASFEKLVRKNPMLKNNLFADKISSMSTISRCNDLLSNNGVIGTTINMIRDVFQRGLSDRLIVLPFENLTKSPKDTLNELHNLLGLEQYEYDFNNVEQLTKEDDFIYGLENLHTVSKEVKPVMSDAIEVLGQDACRDIDNNFKDINDLIP